MAAQPDAELWLHTIIESIDHRLELVNMKLDAAISQTLTKNYCMKDCDIRKNAVDKRYFLGFGGCVVIAVGIMGLAIKFV